MQGKDSRDPTNHSLNLRTFSLTNTKPPTRNTEKTHSLASKNNDIPGHLDFYAHGSMLQAF